MTISADPRCGFDVLDYLHLPAALTPDEVAETTRWMDATEGTSVQWACRLAHSLLHYGLDKLRKTLTLY